MGGKRVPLGSAGSTELQEQPCRQQGAGGRAGAVGLRAGAEELRKPAQEPDFTRERGGEMRPRRILYGTLEGREDEE